MSKETELQAEVDDLTKQVDKLTTENAEQDMRIEELEEELLEARSGEEEDNAPEEAEVILYWNGHVDTSTGGDQSKFGHTVNQDEDGNWYASVPESAVDALVTRPNTLFVEELPEEEQVEEDD